MRDALTLHCLAVEDAFQLGHHLFLSRLAAPAASYTVLANLSPFVAAELEGVLQNHTRQGHILDDGRRWYSWTTDGWMDEGDRLTTTISKVLYP